MHVVVVSTTNYDTADIRLGCVYACIDLFEMREGLQNGLPIGIVFCFSVGPLFVQSLASGSGIILVAGFHIVE